MIVVALLMPVLSTIVPGISLLVPALGLPASMPSAPAGSIPGAGATVFAVEAEGVTRGISVAAAALSIYLAGAFWLLARLGGASLAAGRAARNASPVTDRMATLRVARLAECVGLRRVPRIVESGHADVPLTSGAWRRTIVLPAGWSRWPADMFDAVLVHELAHVARRDVLTQQLALLLRAIFWPSPLGWWLRRHVSVLAERASDDAALSAGIEPVRYAHILATFLGAVSRRPQRAGTLAMARPPLAERRVERVLEWTRSTDMSISQRVKALLVVATFAGVWLAVALRPVPVSASAAMASMPAIGSPQFPAPPPPPPPPLPSKVTTRQRPEPPAPPPPPPVPAETSTRSGQAPPPPPPPPPMPPPPPPPPPDWADLVPNDDFAAGAYSATNTAGLTAPRQLRRVMPKYTANAMRQKVQGQVIVQAIVDVDGVVRRARVIGPLHDELDQQALVAVEQSTFTPGMLAGRPVQVWVVIAMDFRLH